MVFVELVRGHAPSFTPIFCLFTEHVENVYAYLHALEQQDWAEGVIAHPMTYGFRYVSYENRHKKPLERIQRDDSVRKLASESGDVS